MMARCESDKSGLSYSARTEFVNGFTNLARAEFLGPQSQAYFTRVTTAPQRRGSRGAAALKAGNECESSVS